jgi:hypothetical protein
MMNKERWRFAAPTLTNGLPLYRKAGTPDDFFYSRCDRFNGLTQLLKSLPLLPWEPRQILVYSISHGYPSSRDEVVKNSATTGATTSAGAPWS